MKYADYILGTGEKLTAWEEIFGRYLYESRFAGRAPILDVGPGRCWFTRQAPNQITGLDVEPALVEHYRAQGLDLQTGSVTDMPFPPDAFEGVFCCWLFEHLTNPDVALAEIHRVLAPGGYACVIVPSARTIAKTFYDDYTHVRPYTPTSLTQLANEVNFARVQIGPLFWTRGAGRLAPHVKPETMLRGLRLADTVGRQLRMINRNNLLLEAWK